MANPDHCVISRATESPRFQCLHCGAERVTELPMSLCAFAYSWACWVARHRDCPRPVAGDWKHDAETTPQIGYNPIAGSTAFTPNQQMDVDIPNRDEQHGGMEAVGTLSQGFKEEMRFSKNWTELTPGEREALDVIVHKIGRVLSGRNPHDPEHWRDIAGYAVAARRADSHTAPNTP